MTAHMTARVGEKPRPLNISISGRELLFLLYLLLLLYSPPLLPVRRSVRLDNFLLVGVWFLFSPLLLAKCVFRRYRLIQVALLVNAMLIGVAITCNIIAGEFAGGLRTLINFAGFLRWFLVFGWAAYCVRDVRFAGKVLRWTLIAFALHGLAGLLVFLDIEPIVSPLSMVFKNAHMIERMARLGVRSVGMMEVVHDQANLCLFGSVISLGLIIVRNRDILSAKWLWFVFICSLLGMFLTRSRGAYLAFLLSCAFLFLYVSLGAKFKLGALLIVMLLIGLYLIPDRYRRPLQEAMTFKQTRFGETGTLLQGRVENWNKQFDLFLESPICGKGPEIPYEVAFMGDGFYIAHLAYHGLLGMVGYVFVVGALWIFFRRGRLRGPRHSPRYCYAMIAQVLVITTLAANIPRGAYTERLLELGFVLFAVFAVLISRDEPGRHSHPGDSSEEGTGEKR